MKIKKLIISEKGKRLLKSLSCTGCAVLLAGSLSACSLPPTSEIDFEQDNNHSYHYDMGANHVSVSYSTIVDEDIEELPSSITDVSMFNCHFVTSLSTLPDTCPDLSYLELDTCSSITDLSFIYRLSSLKTVILNDICGITRDIVPPYKEGFRFLFQKYVSRNKLYTIVNGDAINYMNSLAQKKDNSINTLKLFRDACKATVRKYGYMQLISALYNGINGDYSSFTNDGDKMLRENMMKYIDQNTFKKYATAMLSELFNNEQNQNNQKNR